MSKISLEPNDSGAGTFSIVSPDSNTNRTLNLPDEAGTILSDASTIDSNNLQSDVYKQSNILGTVSESGGVPTGAIIERGSNSNGEFVKYADGTMICIKRVSSVQITALGAAGQFTTNTPASFVSSQSVAGTWTPTVVLGNAGQRTDFMSREASCAAEATRWRARGNSAWNNSLDLIFFAIGRWF